MSSPARFLTCVLLIDVRRIIASKLPTARPSAAYQVYQSSPFFHPREKDAALANGIPKAMKAEIQASLRAVIL